MMECKNSYHFTVAQKEVEKNREKLRSDVSMLLSLHMLRIDGSSKIVEVNWT